MLDRGLVFLIESVLLVQSVCIVWCTLSEKSALFMLSALFQQSMDLV